ncbi:thermonuclease family protein [Sphingobium fluviale]|uniref:Thermonuclease family protein n=1 Tax=Sphingobium fluviale TaxID=2506423 RepID=A0A4Q1KH29_9SPHN|nr:thermonuclease family protein [Sphingobium fluviale]RXR29023.1 thermonuclease family protein [Sphingobium fluviale]
MKRRPPHRTSWHAYNYSAPRRRPPIAVKPYTILLAAAFAGTVVGIGSSTHFFGREAVAAGNYDGVVTGCHAIDGDTLRCGGERVRLVGIDAPEMPGHCRPGRDCAPGDPYAATASLSGMVRSTMPIQRYGEDKYGRTIAALEGTDGDLSCAQLRDGSAIYKPRWDDSLHVARTCPGVLGR